MSTIPFDRTRHPEDNPESRADYEAWMAELPLESPPPLFEEVK